MARHIDDNNGDDGDAYEGDSDDGAAHGDDDDEVRAMHTMMMARWW